MDLNQTLAHIVTADPATARVLEGFGLDYCCGGALTLEEACAAAGLDPDAVVDELSSGPEGERPGWADLDAAALTDHIEAVHHTYLHAEMPRLVALAQKVAGVHGEHHPELHGVERAVEGFVADMDAHLAKEERVLFPMIRTLVVADEQPVFHCGSLQNPIRVMLMEHDSAGGQLAELRRLTGGYAVPEDGCASYVELYRALAQLEADTHMHVHKENNLLFPAAVSAEERWLGTAP